MSAGRADIPYVDFATIQLWPQAWGWHDPSLGDQTLGYAVANASAYLNLHVKLTAELDRPLVITAFRLPSATALTVEKA